MSNQKMERDTRERLPKSRALEAGGTIYAGTLVALNSSGLAVPAADAAGLRVLGRAENSAVTGEQVEVAEGCFLLDNAGSGNALTLADLGRFAYVADDRTVSKSPGSNGVVAGIVFDVEPLGVWVRVDAVAALLAAHAAQSTSAGHISA